MKTQSSCIPVAVALLVAAVGPGLCGCDIASINSTEAANASEAVDSLESSSSEGAVLSIAAEGAVETMTADALATNAVANAGKLLTPSSCVTATAAGAVATYKLNNCTGPYGLLHLTGTVTHTFSVVGGAVNVAGAATGLAVNGATINISSKGVLTTTGSTRKLVVTTSGSGTGTRGNDITRTGSYTVTWDGTCMTLDGTWSTTAVGKTWVTTVAGFKHCSGMCPAVGATLTYTGGISGVTVTVVLNGDDTGKWTATSGKSGALVVTCAN